MNKKIVFSTLLLTATICVFSFTYKYKQSLKRKPYLTVIGPILKADGLGRFSIELIDALKDDIRISFREAGPFCLDSVPRKVAKILTKNAPIGKIILYQDLLIFNDIPLGGKIKGPKNKTSIRIAHSMFEASLIPSEWVHILNYYFDAVFVPDKFLIEVYKNSGVTIPVFVIPYAVDLKKFWNEPLKNTRNSPMIFANLGTAIPRKNQVKIIQAFHQAFGNSQEVKLKLNSRGSEAACLKAIKDEIDKLRATNIECTQGVLQEEDYFNFFKNIDCYVSLSLGEGFSLQPREAMAMGIPAIVSDNTGQATICATGLVRKVDSPNTKPAFFQLYKNYHGVFYDCTTEDAALALRDVYENYDHYLKQGPAAREWVKQSSFDQLKPLHLGLLKPKKIVLGNSNEITPDCLFTDSKELCMKFHQILGIPFKDTRKNIYD